MVLLILMLFMLYIVYRIGSSFGGRKVAENTTEQVEEATTKTPRFNTAPYSDAARKIADGALDAARLAGENARDVVAEVQREQKLAKLQSLLEDEELLNELKNRVK